MSVKVKEFYQNRVDHLYLRTHNMKTGWVTEYFTEGRSHAVKGLTLFCVSTRSSCVSDSGMRINRPSEKFIYVCHWIGFRLNTELFTQCYRVADSQ